MTIIYKVIENTSSLQFLEVQPGEINDPDGVDRLKKWQSFHSWARLCIAIEESP